MNDFGVNITGFTGVVKLKPGFAWPKTATVKDRTFTIDAGPGTSPDAGTRRTVRGHWSDGAQETLSSYDFEYVNDKEGKKINRLPEPEMDVTPVKVAVELAPGLPSKEELQAKVRRKRG